ncbi:ATP-binding cassette domain-containing protein [Cupriavidus basilensis]
MSAYERGRFTVCGDNGAGKSTLLSVLKTRLGDEAILIPAQHGKLEWQHSGRRVVHGSTDPGATGRNYSTQTTSRFLLLDEWDANLDRGNRQAVSELLDRLSQGRVIVEVRH